MRRDARTTRRVDRVALALIGLGAVTVAVLILLLSTGAIHRLTRSVDTDRPLFNDRLARSLDDHRIWWQLGTVGVGLLLVVLGLLWLRRQLPSGRRLHDTTLTNLGDDIPGRTSIDGRALANGLEADLQRHPDVLDARADVLLDDGVVRVRLTTTDDVDIERLTTDAVRPAVARLAAVADAQPAPAAQIDVRLRPRPARNLQ